MARSSSSPILAQLRNAKTLPEQTSALQALKNEIVGHVQKKEAWVGLGVLDPIVRTLSANHSSSKSNGKDATPQLVSGPLSDEDGVKLQALQLVASFANGTLLNNETSALSCALSVPLSNSYLQEALRFYHHYTPLEFCLPRWATYLRLRTPLRSSSPLSKPWQIFPLPQY